MRGQVQAGGLRLGRTPVRERLATWVDARVRKRQADRRAEAVVVARLAADRQAARRAAGTRTPVLMSRRPY